MRRQRAPMTISRSVSQWPPQANECAKRQYRSTSVAFACQAVGGQDPFAEQQLHALAAVTDGPLPVFGRLTAADVLKFVGS